MKSLPVSTNKLTEMCIVNRYIHSITIQLPILKKICKYLTLSPFGIALFTCNCTCDGLEHLRGQKRGLCETENEPKNKNYP